MVLKACARCGESKPMEAFSRKSRTSDERRSQCKDCRRAALQTWRKTSPRHAEYVAENAERFKERSAAYYREHGEVIRARSYQAWLDDPEARREASRRYYAENRERALKTAKAWREANPDVCRKNALAWRVANPERRRETARAWDKQNLDLRRLRESRRRARQRAAFVDDVHPLLVLERDDGVCGICGEDVDPFNFHVDHIVPLSRGGEHSYANVQPSHPLCNMGKGARVN